LETITEHSFPNKSKRANNYMAKPQIERRTNRRYRFCLPVVAKNGDGAEISAYTRDVSSRGICFFVKEPPAVGCPLQLIFTLPPEVTCNGPLPIKCRGRVIRVQQNCICAAVAAVIEDYVIG
jgi:hypothetical protein